MGHAAGREIAGFGRNKSSGKQGADLITRMPREELPQVLTGFA
jgi:hypothetical protein